MVLGFRFDTGNASKGWRTAAMQFSCWIEPFPQSAIGWIEK
jgi:hypothetical protein